MNVQWCWCLPLAEIMVDFRIHCLRWIADLALAQPVEAQADFMAEVQAEVQAEVERSTHPHPHPNPQPRPPSLEPHHAHHHCRNLHHPARGR